MCCSDNKILATGTNVGEIFLWSFLDYSFIQQLSGITFYRYELN